MATADRPPAKIDGKPNPAYQKWYREQKKAAKNPKRIEDISGPESDAVYVVVDAAPPGPLTLRVVKLANNNRFVLCADPAVKGKTVPVKLLRAGTGLKLLRKPIKAELREGKFHQVK